MHRADLHSVFMSCRSSHPGRRRHGESCGRKDWRQRAEQLSKIKKTGGLMKEVRAARETAEEVQEMGERSLFYIQRAPRIVSNAMEMIRRRA
jgi:hypothetical protein